MTLNSLSYTFPPMSDIFDKSEIVQVGEQVHLISKEPPKEAPPLAPVCPAYLAYWRPNKQELQWFRSLISAAKDGGIWQVQATRAVYTFDKKNKIVTLTKGPIDQWFWMNCKTFEVLGWKCLIAVNIATGGGKSNIENL